jgi:hypothetical protein
MGLMTAVSFGKMPTPVCAALDLAVEAFHRVGGMQVAPVGGAGKVMFQVVGLGGGMEAQGQAWGFSRRKRRETARPSRERVMHSPVSEPSIVPELGVAADLVGQPLPISEIFQVGPISAINLYGIATRAILLPWFEVQSTQVFVFA